MGSELLYKQSFRESLLQCAKDLFIPATQSRRSALAAVSDLSASQQCRRLAMLLAKRRASAFYTIHPSSRALSLAAVHSCSKSKLTGWKVWVGANVRCQEPRASGRRVVLAVSRLC